MSVTLADKNLDRFNNHVTKENTCIILFVYVALPLKAYSQISKISKFEFFTPICSSPPKTVFPQRN